MSDKTHLLIVEDDPDLLDMLDHYFRVQGYDVMTAAWGEDAVRQTTDRSPSLVVLDIRLPDIDGYEVCRRIRTNRRTQDIPVIFLTEKRDRVDKLAGLELGVVDYITKPFDIQELRLRVRNALSRAKLSTMVNPVTNFSEGVLVDEKLETMLLGDTPWAALCVSIQGLEAFREQYGFVNADDVLRAVTLMMNNALREVGNESDFIGHLGSTDFAILTDQEKLPAIRERVEVRIRQKMEYFYPLKDRDKARQAMAQGRLSLVVTQVIPDKEPIRGAAALKDLLLKGHSPFVANQNSNSPTDPTTEAPNADGAEPSPAR